ncbi:RNA polymerase sigma factor [Kocuria massiliensis]|uniref:RNA polymerase sigma factor n=1 Tax=Kocuria massiliensis TaxID=1926282 RepID=UPI0022B97EA9|nr:sigma-70 family RNA polymerase sigma factor [Kocuria massiliensis]
MNTKIPFELIVQRHGPTVWRVCRALLRSPQDAEDAWAETFAAGFKAWPNLPGSTNAEAWLVTVARRKAIDVARGNTRRAIPTEELPEAGERLSASSPEDPEDAAVRRDDVDRLWDAVHRLPEGQRLAVTHHHLGGFTYREVAEIIGGNETSVRRAAADGMKNLRKNSREITEGENHE